MNSSQLHLCPAPSAESNSKVKPYTNADIMFRSLLVIVVFVALLVFIVVLRAEELSANGKDLINSSSSILKVVDDIKVANGNSAQQEKEFRYSLFGAFKSKVTRTTDNLKCGHPIRTYDERIVGGKEASIGEFPWIISLQREKYFWFGFKAFYHSCGGSLVTPSWIVTAAHCLYNKEVFDRAVAGVDNMKYLYRAQLRTISQSIMHPDFDMTSYDNDIALIKVSRPFNLESSFSHVSAICLDRAVPILPYDIATIAGFGANAFREQSRNHLYKTDIAVIDQRICNSSFDGMITDNMICAGGMISNKRDACSGDSGGPLQIETEDHVSLVGVVSFGNSCATQGYPGIYTRLENYYDWLIDNIDEPLLKP